MLAGSLLETAGVLLLVPVIQILLGEPGWPGAAALDLLAGFGLTTPRARAGAVLAFFAILVLVRFVVLLRRDVEIARLREGFVTDLRARAFRSLATLPWPDLAGRGHGRIGHALARDVDRVSDSVGSVITAVLGLLHLAVQLSIAFALAPLLMIVIALLAAVGFAALGRLRRRAVRMGGEMTEADFALFSTTTTYLGGLKPARAHGLEADYATAFTATARRVADERVRHIRDHALARLSVQATVGIVGLATVAAGMFLVPIAPERLIVLILILARLSGPFQSVQSAAQYVGYAAAAYASLTSLTGRIEHRDTAVATQPPGRPLDRPPAIRFRDVSWAGARAELLAGIDCELPAGRVTALTGHSGAGKSLFCDLATGLLTPCSGRVELDGVALDAGLTARLAASLAYVGQEPFVLEDSLRANLTWGCGEVADDEVWGALDAVGASGIARAAGGLGASVRAGGSRFSGGERQRFRLAHALLRRPRLLVLDEATNALDLDAERAVLAGLRRAAPDATFLMVTHRPSTLEIADHVLVLERGRLAWAGAPSAMDTAGRLRLAASQP